MCIFTAEWMAVSMIMTFGNWEVRTSGHCRQWGNRFSNMYILTHECKWLCLSFIFCTYKYLSINNGLNDLNILILFRFYRLTQNLSKIKLSNAITRENRINYSLMLNLICSDGICATFTSVYFNKCSMLSIWRISLVYFFCF